VARRYTRELIDLPAQPTTAELVLEVAGNERSNASRLAAVIETDIALTARLLRLANSPYYGVPRQVSSVANAVVLLGFDAVRALALSAACGMAGDRDDGPHGFWRHAITTAAAASVVAERVGLSANDAFTAGLIHDLGSVLLHRHDPHRFAETQVAGDGRIADILAAELRAFGVTHAQVGSEAAEAWAFPRAFVEAIGNHHGAAEPVHTLGRVVRVGEALALSIEFVTGHPSEPELDRMLPLVRLPESQADSLRDQTRERIERLADVLGASSAAAESAP
jgi:putative nucleotidyltransferase with HDIG domain